MLLSIRGFKLEWNFQNLKIQLIFVPQKKLLNLNWKNCFYLQHFCLEINKIVKDWFLINLKYPLDQSYSWFFYPQTLNFPVVYFWQCLGAAHSKHWSKYAFSHFLPNKHTHKKKLAKFSKQIIGAWTALKWGHNAVTAYIKFLSEL